MATKLDKELTRESSVKYGDREILVTLTENQEISFKLKGMKSGDVSISIEQLYKQLIGGDVEEIEKPKVKVVEKRYKKSDDDIMISLYSLRTANAVARLDYPIKVELEKTICELIGQNIKLVEVK